LLQKSTMISRHIMDERQKWRSALSEDRPTDTAGSTERPCDCLKLCLWSCIMLWYLVARGRLKACCYRGMIIDASLNWSSCRKTKQRRSIIADDARAFSPPGCAWRGCSGKETIANWKDLKLKKYTSVTEGPLIFYETLKQLYLCTECILLMCVFTYRTVKTYTLQLPSIRIFELQDSSWMLANLCGCERKLYWSISKYFTSVYSGLIED
jgi:hypothetical protein